MTTSPFAPAQRHTVKARIALMGPSGSGKTWTALALAEGLSGGTPVAVIDTEKGSASLYAHRFAFDVVELGPPFSPDRYVELIHQAEQGGYGVVVIDSLSHAWFDEGGVLDIVDKASARSGNKFAGWQQGTPKQNALVNAILRSSIHVVVTMRSKTEYAQDRDGQGRTTIRKVGIGPVQRDSIEYEFTVVGELDVEHNMKITKARFEHLQDLVFTKPDRTVGEDILREFGEESPALVPAGESVRAEAGPAQPAAPSPAPGDTEPAAGDGGTSSSPAAESSVRQGSEHTDEPSPETETDSRGIPASGDGQSVSGVEGWEDPGTPDIDSTPATSEQWMNLLAIVDGSAVRATNRINKANGTSYTKQNAQMQATVAEVAKAITDGR